jgi:hypothetical protein
MSLRLFTDNVEHSEPVIPIRWCVDRKALDKLKELGVLKPFLFISIQLQGEGEDAQPREVLRKLVPLERAMEYIELNHAGRHIIRAFIVWAENFKNEIRLLVDVLTERRRGDYVNHLYQSDGSLRGTQPNHLLSPNYFLDGTQGKLEVSVGKEFFAPEPSAREKQWVNLWFGDGAFDQCEFRRRRFVAYTIQPFVVPIWAVLVVLFRAVIAGLSAFLGVKGVDFSPILHPFRDSLSDIRPGYHRSYGDKYFTTDDNYYWTDKNGESRSRFFLLLYPPFLTVLAVVLYFIDRFQIWNLALRLGVLVAVIVLLSVVSISVAKRIDPILDKQFKKMQVKKMVGTASEKRKPAKLDPQAEALRVMYETELQFVACDGSTLPAKVTALPKSRQTVHLRFQDFKAKVCRPFARG